MRAKVIAQTPIGELVALSEKFGSGKARYCEVYELFLRSSKNEALNFLEIGIGGYDDPLAGGASLRMWHAYFSNAQIFALDIFDKQAQAAERLRIYQGSQTDVGLLQQIADDMGRMDVVLDDGSHFSEHVVKTFETLFPLLASGGLYIIEDIGTSYWPDYGGSKDPEDIHTSMAYFKRLADGLNSADSQGAVPATELNTALKAVHFYPSLVVVEKA